MLIKAIGTKKSINRLIKEAIDQINELCQFVGYNINASIKNNCKKIDNEDESKYNMKPTC